MHPSETKLPTSAGSIENPSAIIVEISNDQHTIKALEVVCFERKFIYKKRDPSRYITAPGKIMYEIWHNDPIQLFWLGAAFQSLLTQ